MNALEALAAKQPTTVLMDSLAILAGIDRTLTTEERMARFAIINALETRYPEVNAATLAWCETADTARTYEEVIFSALKELVLA